MGNYDIITETRELKIYWGQVSLLPRSRQQPDGQLPSLFDVVKHLKGGTILVKEVYVTGILKKAVGERLSNATDTWRRVGRGYSETDP